MYMNTNSKIYFCMLISIIVMFMMISFMLISFLVLFRHYSR